MMAVVRTRLAVGIVLAAAAAFAMPGAAAPAVDEGAAVYKRCAACHLANGAGVPGAFPPLRGDIRALAARSAGRRYLTLVVTRGVSGPITVEGKIFRGVMPTQSGLDDAQVAAVLNHVLGTFAKVGPAARPFTAAEVAQVKAGSAGLTPAAIGKLNAQLSGQ